MIYHRDYMHPEYDEDEPGRISVLRWSALTWIIFGCVVFFVFQNVFNLWLNLKWVEVLFALQGATFQRGFFWTLATYSLLHGSLLHLLLNMFIIFIFGAPLQKYLGEQRFFGLYMFSVIVGGLSYLVAHFQGAMLLGASAGGLGLMTVFCILNAEQEMTFLIFFVLPVRIKPKYILWLTMGLELFGFFFDELVPSRSSGIAYSAHLGGILAGWLFYRQLMSGASMFNWMKAKTIIEQPAWMRKKQAAGSKTGRYQVNITSPADLRKEIDSILEASERELLSLQRRTGIEWFWKLYFALT